MAILPPGATRNSDGSISYQGYKFPGLNKPVRSKAKDKKYVVLASKGGSTKLIHFGDSNFRHNYSESAKKSYRARAGGIKNKSGQSTANDRLTANYWSMHFLWSKNKPADGSTAKKDSLTPTELEAYNAALESRKDEITQWRNDGKSETYIETRIIEGLRNDGVIGEEDVPRMDVKFLNEALHQRVVAEAKRKFAIWPSAYASAWVVAEYKRRNGKFRGDDAARVDAIDKWFQEKWVRISGSGEVMGSCGDKGEGEGKPKCLPLAKARSMSKEERIAAVRRKRREDPNPDRKGKAIMVSTKGKR